MGGGRVEEPRIGQHGVEQTAKAAQQHRGAQRQGRDTCQAGGRGSRAQCCGALPHHPPAPGQQDQAGAHDAQQRNVERGECALGRGAGNDDETRPDGDRHDCCQQADGTRRKTHRGIIGGWGRRRLQRVWGPARPRWVSCRAIDSLHAFASCFLAPRCAAWRPGCCCGLVGSGGGC